MSTSVAPRDEGWRALVLLKRALAHEGDGLQPVRHSVKVSGFSR
jgi:hypothetical protein